MKYALLLNFTFACLIVLGPAKYGSSAPADGFWNIETVTTLATGSLPPYGTIALDAMGDPHILFRQQTAPFQVGGTLRHAVRKNGTWEIEVIKPYTNYTIGTSPKMEFDSEGRIHILNDDSGLLTYGLFDGNSWQLEELDLQGIRSSTYDLAIDSQNNPHLAFNDTDVNFGQQRGHHAFRGSDGNWSSTFVGGFVPFSIDLDASDDVYIAGWRNNLLHIASQSMSGWTVDTVADGGFQASLAIDAAGNLHVGHTSTSTEDLTYSKLEEGMWVSQVVQPLGSPYQGASLALDPRGLPQMSYERHLGPIHTADDQVMHAFLKGSTWLTSVVDPQLSTESRPSMVVDSNYVAHVVYSTQTGELRYATLRTIPEPGYLVAVIGSAVAAVLYRRRSRACFI